MMKKSLVLQAEQVTVDFDGFVAVNQMNLELEEGELRFLIGPNGAGKTTMLDMMCGKTKPTGGRIIYRDALGEEHDVTKMKEYDIAELGIGRKFQAPSIFGSLTVYENMELAMRQSHSIWTQLWAKRTPQEKEKIMSKLELIGLPHLANVRAGSLSHGQKQWLEIGMILIEEPRLLLFDEPVAGMTDAETEKTGHLLREIAKTSSVVVVEHDMDFVRAFAQKVTVMHEGKFLFEGTMDQVSSDPKVREVYLGKGKEREAIAAGEVPVE